MGPRRLRPLRGRGDLPVGLALLAVACAAPEPVDTGCELVGSASGKTVYMGQGPLDEYFPTYGARSATYFGDPSGILYVEKQEPVEVVDEVELVTFAYTIDGAPAARIVWASDHADGIRIAGLAEGDGDVVRYDPPIQLTSPRNYQYVGQCVRTATGGATYTATFVGQEDIRVAWGDLTWYGATHFSLTSDDADAFFLGDYWLVTRYGPGWMRLGDTLWDLADYELETE